MDEPMIKPHIEPGMAVRIEVQRLRQAIAAHLSGTDMGIQVLLDNAVREFIESGGLQREVEIAVAEELPRLVHSVVTHALFNGDVREAIGNAVTKALLGGLKDG